jgi:hypothetical protein
MWRSNLFRTVYDHELNCARLVSSMAMLQPIGEAGHHPLRWVQHEEAISVIVGVKFTRS